MATVKNHSICHACGNLILTKAMVCKWCGAAPETLSQTEKCAHCGMSISRSRTVCPFCEENLHRPCTICGTELGQNWKLCPVCGALQFTPGNTKAPLVLQKKGIAVKFAYAMLFLLVGAVSMYAYCDYGNCRVERWIHDVFGDGTTTMGVDGKIHDNPEEDWGTSEDPPKGVPSIYLPDKKEP